MQKARKSSPASLGSGELAPHRQHTPDLNELRVRSELLDQALVAENALARAGGADHLNGLGAIVLERWKRHSRFRLSFGHGFSLAHGARVRLR
ncbi:MAG: hypothetical protein EON58_20925 [Alphaproteobacteria bacterium]|nr:MAG: hypothetical protein EON58_20925 [Alphaproteobacteria bacterium]